MLDNKMTMYEQDPDVVRWGLHLLDVCSLTNYGSPGTITCYQRDMSQSATLEECFSDQIHGVVENGDVFTYGFQEDLPMFASAEASGSADGGPGEEHQNSYALQEDLPMLASEEALGLADGGPGEKHQNAYFLTTDWIGHSERFPNSVEEYDQDTLPEIEDESALDGELGKRLNQMLPVPHVPKINGEIPSVDEATSDHGRLLNRLQLYDLVEIKISGDGNCQFRSLSDQIYRTPEHHKFVRNIVVDQLKLQPELYKNYVPMDFEEYLKKMKKTGEWGDHVTLQAAADSFGFKIFVLTSFKDTCYIEILPQIQKSNRIIFLSFWAEVHYNSIYPSGELPFVESHKKKWWWWS